ncbi:MAG TPA: TIGR03808 family TAT-translocated repetitive protein, partial [Xanthobacteraceae bacterium]
YSEFDFEGAIIANNTVDGAEVGVSVANFNVGGRLAVVQGNIFRNLAPRHRPGEPEGAHGMGIYVEADSAVTGNVVENATFAGIMAGYGPYLRDVTITGNVVRAADIGVAVSVVPGAGGVVIADNMISGSRRGAIMGMDHEKVITGDLTRDGAARYAQLAISGNRVN